MGRRRAAEAAAAAEVEAVGTLSAEGSGAETCPLCAGEGIGVVPSLASLMSDEGNALTVLLLGGNGVWPAGGSAELPYGGLVAPQCGVGGGTGVASGLEPCTSDEAPAILGIGLGWGRSRARATRHLPS